MCFWKTIFLTRFIWVNCNNIERYRKWTPVSKQDVFNDDIAVVAFQASDTSGNTASRPCCKRPMVENNLEET